MPGENGKTQSRAELIRQRHRAGSKLAEALSRSESGAWTVDDARAFWQRTRGETMARHARASPPTTLTTLR